MAITREDVEKLKRDWQKDPCWDIETTEGFEEYKDELKAFRLDYEKQGEENARTNPICPIMSATQSEFASCVKERCAWFVTWLGQNQCALKVIAHKAAYGLPVE